MTWTDPTVSAAFSSSSCLRSKFGSPVAGKKNFDMTQKLICLVLNTYEECVSTGAQTRRSFGISPFAPAEIEAFSTFETCRF